MKYLLLAAALLACSLGKPVETTPFFNKNLNYTLSFKTYSGYENIDWYFPETTARMYYSFWQGIGDDLKDKSVPVIIWLQGGPGADSQFGCFNELGPLYIHPDGHVQENGYSWSNRGHLVCVDQPLGVGFSFNRGKQVTNTYQASLHFTNFLHNFLSEWNLQDNPLYIAGESYAGHYIPSFTRFIVANASLNINLRGVMIGDGYLDPINQMNFYDSMMYTAGVASLAAREVTTSTQNKALLNLFSNRYQQATNLCDWIVDNDDTAAQYYGNLNLMNFRKYDQDNINPDYWKFLNSNKKEFGIPDDVSFNADGDAMYKAFGVDISMSFASELEWLLNRGVRVLIYNGQNDVIVNTAGVLNYLNTLDWHGLRAWSKTPKQQWILNGKNVGWHKAFDNLAFVLIRNAGHLVPADQPAIAGALIARFISGLPW